ncbi:hypothetical protein A3Q56_05730 [Intoshia linei]|uniref:Uncharacterized protein n=1 Tax=Intoshia linei TaxID=1819745 RepID=A0A177AX21_9BILA|nr:hypothetical protein A3Q56_05730 [Intoshia linei]
MTENEDKAIENSSNVVNTQNSDVVQNTNQSDNNRNTTNWFSIIKTLVFRMIVFYFITSFFRKSVNKVEPNAPTSMHIYKNAYLQNELIDIFLYLSESPHTVNFEKPLFLLKKIKFASYENGDDDYGTYTKQHRYFLTKVCLCILYNIDSERFWFCDLFTKIMTFPF